MKNMQLVLLSTNSDVLSDISNYFSAYISLRSELSLKPLKVGLQASSSEKIDIIAEKVAFSGRNFRNSKAPNSKNFAHPEE